MPNATVKRQLWILAVTVVIAPLAYWGPHLVETVRDLEVFAVREGQIEVLGIKRLTKQTVVSRLGLGSMASFWGDAAVWRELVTADPLVREVEIQRKFPNGLIITVDERVPVAFAGTSMLEPVDAEGYQLPIDPTAPALDLPIISSESRGPDNAGLFPEEVRTLAAELEHLNATRPEFANRISTIRLHSQGAVAVRLHSPDVEFIMPIRTERVRIEEGESALGHIMQLRSGRPPAEVDLRFLDQVVVRPERAIETTSTYMAGGR